jgi:hypothetical protein
VVVVVVENLNSPRHISLSSCRNPEFAARFHRTGILPAFLVWDILQILATVVVIATFGANPSSLNKSGTVSFDCVAMRESVFL